MQFTSILVFTWRPHNHQIIEEGLRNMLVKTALSHALSKNMKSAPEVSSKIRFQPSTAEREARATTGAVIMIDTESTGGHVIICDTSKDSLVIILYSLCIRSAAWRLEHRFEKRGHYYIISFKFNFNFKMLLQLQ